MAMQSEIGVAIVGAGYWGQNLIRNFWDAEPCRLVSVCDKDSVLLSRALRRYPTIEVTQDYASVLRHLGVDAVVIATPASTHYDFARRALDAGKHVLVEKPLSTSSSEAERLIELAAAKLKVLMVDHTFLYTAAVRRMRQLVDAGEIGDLLYYDSVRINLGLVQSDTNVLWDLGPHDFSILDHLCHLHPRTVSAIAGKHFGYPFEDIVYVTVRFESSLIAHFHLNWLSPVKVRLTLVGGSKKMIVYDDMESNEKVKVYDKGISVNHSPESRNRLLTSYRQGNMFAPHLDTAEALRLVAREFLSSIAENRTPMTDGAAGLRVVRMLEAAQKSIEENGREIEMPDSVIISAASSSGKQSIK
jgi:predicted dehydrogenase